MWRRVSITDDSSGNSHSDRVLRYILSYNRSCTYESILSDLDPWIDNAASTDGRETLHSRAEQGPFTMSSRMFIVRERYVWSDEDIILNNDSGGDEYKWTNLAIVSYRYAFFDVHVRVDLCVLSNLASVQIYLIINPGVPAYDRFLDDGEFRTSHLFRGYLRDYREPDLDRTIMVHRLARSF